MVKLDSEQFVESQKWNQIKMQPWQTLEWYQYINLLGKDKLENEEKEQKKLLNKFLQILFKQEFINPDYNTIKKFRDTLAKHRWKLRQNVRTSEREFIQEAMVRYYGQILEKDGCYFVALFDKDKFKNDIKNIVTDSQTKDKWIEGDSFKIYKYSQLSFPALEKLCLSEDWDLLSNSSLQKAWDKYKNQKKDIEWRCDFHKNWQDKSCTSCKSNEMEMRRSFLKAFKMHILQALEKLKNDEGYKWEDWSYLYWELQQKNSVEDIVSFINQKFYKLEQKYIEQEEVFKLADTWEILLFQVYSKDFNILDERFTSNEENLEEGEKNCWENNKTIKKTKREDWMQKNLFTLYFENALKNDDKVFLWQEWAIFFRKANKESEKKRFRNNKFFWSFDIIFNKWLKNYKWKLCEKSNFILNNNFKKITLDYFNKKKNSDEITILWIDRGSISENINQNTKISMLGFCIIKLKKVNNNYQLSDILNSWDINWLKRAKAKSENWVIVWKWNNIQKEKQYQYIDFKKILSELKIEIEKESNKKWKKDLIKILEKKKWITCLLVNQIINFIDKYKIDYIALENLDNKFTDEKTFKDEMKENSLSAYLYQNFEIQLFNKLQYIYLKNRIKDINKTQLFPKYKIDEIKKIDSDSWFKKEKTDNKIIWNIIFVETAWTSSKCFNCDWDVNKHKISCENCGISVKNNGSIELKNYSEKFMPKSILENQNTQVEFNNDARAWLVIAKRALEYLEYLESQNKDETK